jgi:transposase
MISTPSTLPDDPAKLKKIIAEMTAVQQRHESEIELLREENRKLFDQLFGRKSEKLFGGSPQLLLFDMPEIDPETEVEEAVTIETHRRKKPGRKPLPDDLPRINVVHDIDEAEKVCSCGAELERIGEEISEKLDIIPATIRVIRHIRPKYGCRSCEGVEDDGPTIKIAPVPPQIVPKGIASAGLLAHILTAKFDDALPFYRQEKQFARLGVEIGRVTMCNWAMKAAKACQPLQEILTREIRSGPLINIDETTVQVLKEPGRPPTTKSYMWIFRGGNVQKPSLVYRYSPTRSGNVASSFIDKYVGAVQTDGYGGYNFLDARESITHLGCWAHVRRKFMDARKAGSSKSKKSGSVDVALGYIRKLYAIEKRAQNQQFDEKQLVALRHKEVGPTLDKFRKWLEKKSLHVVPKSLLGKAVSYALDQWPRLISYLDIGCATPDNNLAENAIRPFVIGRKNWLFAGTPEGAEASATIYSLIETAKANALDSYSYLRYLFENLPFATSDENYQDLLPHKLDADKIALPKGFSVV